MAIPLSYSLRSARSRRLTTFLTAAGMALVVFVFATVFMFAEGLEKTLVETGSFDNAQVIRKGSFSDVQSGISREHASIVESAEGIARADDGGVLSAKEVVVLVTLGKRYSGKPSNVAIRGVEAHSILLRPQVRLVEGRLPRPGTTEVMVGASVAKRFAGADLGGRLRFAVRDWQVVGVFDAGATGFSSEIWGDSDQIMQAFRRPLYSIVIFRLASADGFGRVKKVLEADPRLTLDVKRESEYYAEQSKVMALFLKILGGSLTAIFSLGAVIGAMITMYSAVASRTSEIGTLRALGFGRLSILAAFVAESAAIGLAGGGVGLIFASFLQFFTVSTMNVQTFSELTFSFTLTFRTAVIALLVSLLMGLGGGLLPAIRASRMSIVDALRAE